MIDRLATKQRISRIVAMLIAVIVALMVAHSGVVGAQASGNLAQTEMQLAPYLATGGSLDDLCDSDDSHIPGCPECDLCCSQSQGMPTAALSFVDVWHGLVPSKASPPKTDNFARPRSPSGPPVRAPPVHI